jgi:phosphatidylglycerophosphate synthase
VRLISGARRRGPCYPFEEPESRQDPPSIKCRMETANLNRRPLKTRSRRWAQHLAAHLASTAISANQISVLSVVFAAAGAGALLVATGPWPLVVCAVCIQLRLGCNLLDGMVALEGGKKSPVGVLYNEIPDRIADSLFIVAAGYCADWPSLGWCGALLAALTAYIRVLGGSLGLAQDFRGPMAKPHRMAVLTVGCLIGAGESAQWGSQYSLLAAVLVITFGSLITCATRIRAMRRALSIKPTENS